MYLCYPDLSTAHPSNFGAIFIWKCLQPIWLQSTLNNTNRSPSQCRASGMELLCLRCMKPSCLQTRKTWKYLESRADVYPQPQHSRVREGFSRMKQLKIGSPQPPIRGVLESPHENPYFAMYKNSYKIHIYYIWKIRHFYARFVHAWISYECTRM